VPRRRAVLDLSPSRLELTVWTGSGTPQSKAERISVTEFNETWPRALEVISQHLNPLVKAIGAAGAETTILYHAPTSVVLTTPVPSTAGPKQALLAARLALGDAANRSLAENPHDLERVWRDDESTVAEAAEHAHVLSFADAEETAEALVRTARAAGLHTVGLVPAETVGLTCAVDAALERSKASAETVIALYFGEHVCTLVAARKGRLRFVRRMGTGTETLVDALAREIRPANAAPVTLDHAQAATLLYRRGIPARGQAFDPESGIDADAVLPLVQPVLQRCIIELKQSLRFGLDETERAGAKLIVLGVGSRIGRLPQLIAEQSALSLVEHEAPAKSDLPTSSADGLIHDWVQGRQLKVRLLPASARRMQTARRARRGMFVGFAAAAALVAYAAFDVRMDLAAQNKRIDAANARLEAAKPIAELNTRLIAAQTGVSAAKQRMLTRLSSASPWDAAMVALSRCTPDAIKITEFELTFERGKPVCRLTGRTPLPATGDANAVMRSFLDSLATVPLVKSTRLGATQRADSDTGPIQSFEMTITLVELPAFANDPRPDLASLQPDTEDPQ
jgi:hypothetical protein